MDGARLIARATHLAAVATTFGFAMSDAAGLAFILPSNLGISPHFATACVAAMVLAGVINWTRGRDFAADEKVMNVLRLMATSRNFHRWRMAVRANHLQRMRSRWELADAEAGAEEANYLPAGLWTRDDAQPAGLDSRISTAAAGFHDGVRVGSEECDDRNTNSCVETCGGTEDSDPYACPDETMLSESLSDPSLPTRETTSAGLSWQAAAAASDSELSQQRSLTWWPQSPSSGEEDAGAATGSCPPPAHQPPPIPRGSLGVSAITGEGGRREGRLTPSRVRRLRQISRRWSAVYNAFRVWSARENPPPHI